jgi:predicted nucleic acid-binding protein
MPDSSKSVVDANIAIFKLIPTSQTPLALKLWETFQAEHVSLHAPRLWIYELTSTVQKYRAAGRITEIEKERAIRTAFDMSLGFVEDAPELCTSAIKWAERLHQLVAYDGFYLAAAEQLDAPFWTADKRLANNARQLGVKWVHWMGDLE